MGFEVMSSDVWSWYNAVSRWGYMYDELQIGPGEGMLHQVFCFRDEDESVIWI